jgi:hypothetical protein
MEPEANQEGQWQPQGNRGDQEAQNAVGNPVGRPGRNGGTLAPLWAPGNHPRGGRPKGSVSIRTAIARELEANPEHAREIARATIDTAKARKSKRQMAATVFITEGVDGKVESKVAHTSTSARVVIHGLASGPMDPQVVQGTPTLPEVARGPSLGGAVRALVSAGGADGSPGADGATGAPVRSQVADTPSGAHLPPGVAALEGRMVTLESQVGQMMVMLKALVERGGTA